MSTAISQGLPQVGSYPLPCWSIKLQDYQAYKALFLHIFGLIKIWNTTKFKRDISSTKETSTKYPSWHSNFEYYVWKERQTNAIICLIINGLIDWLFGIQSPSSNIYDILNWRPKQNNFFIVIWKTLYSLYLFVNSILNVRYQ